MRFALWLVGLLVLGTLPVSALAQIDDAASGGYRRPAADAGSLPLKPRESADRDAANRPRSGLQTAITVGGSLAAVLGVFFLVVWLLRRASPGGMGALPSEVFEVLGRAPLANHQQAQLVRCGGKLLLIAIHATGGVRSLAEITDPVEVERLTELCRLAHGRGQRSRPTPRPVEGDHA